MASNSMASTSTNKGNITGIAMKDTEMTTSAETDVWELLSESEATSEMDEITFSPTSSSLSISGDAQTIEPVFRAMATEAETQLATALKQLKIEFERAQAAHAQTESELKAQIEDIKVDKDKMATSLTDNTAMLKKTRRELAQAKNQLGETKADLLWADDKLEEMLNECHAIASEYSDLKAVNENLNAGLAETVAKLVSTQAELNSANDTLSRRAFHESELYREQDTTLRLISEWLQQAEAFIVSSSATEADLASSKQDLQAAHRQLAAKEQMIDCATQENDNLRAENASYKNRLRDAFILFMNGTYEEGDEKDLPLEWLPRLPRYAVTGSEFEYSGSGSFGLGDSSTLLAESDSSVLAETDENESYINAW